MVVGKMKILCCAPDGGAFLYITKGWANAFYKAGHQFKRWDGTHSMIEEFRPHIYIGCSGWKQEFPKKYRGSPYDTKVAIHVNPHGNHKIGSYTNGPVIDENKDTINWVIKQNPDLVFGYGDKVLIDKYWSGWEKSGIPTLPMMNAGDSIHFYPDPSDKYRADVGYIGGHWPYKSVNIDKYLKPVAKKLNCLIYGWSRFPVDYKARGKIFDGEDRRLFSSVKVAPCVSEPHTTSTGIDIPERIFKVSLCGALAISDPVSGMDRVFSNKSLVMAKNPKEYLELCEYYIKNNDERINKARNQMFEILDKHTYLHRMSSLLERLGFSVCSDRMLKIATDIRDNRVRRYGH